MNETWIGTSDKQKHQKERENGGYPIGRNVLDGEIMEWGCGGSGSGG